MNRDKATIIESKVKDVGILLVEENKDYVNGIEYRKYYYSSKSIREQHINELSINGWNTGDYQKVFETLYRATDEKENNVRVCTASFESSIDSCVNIDR